MSSFEFNLQDFQDTRSFFHKKEISKKWNYNGQKLKEVDGSEGREWERSEKLNFPKKSKIF